MELWEQVVGDIVRHYAYFRHTVAQLLSPVGVAHLDVFSLKNSQLECQKQNKLLLSTTYADSRSLSSACDISDSTLLSSIGTRGG